MTTEETVREVKKALRSAMNGVLSAQMRRAGMPYRLVFGVEIPRLLSIAQEFPADRRLAQALWNESIRECKMLAAMLMPQEEMLPEVAEIWVEEIPTAEIAQTTVMYLFSRTAWAPTVAFEWIASDHPMRQLCGFLILARLLSQGAEFNEPSVLEIRDQAEATLPQADLHLQKAIHAVLGRMDAQE